MLSYMCRCNCATSVLRTMSALTWLLYIYIYIYINSTLMAFEGKKWKKKRKKVLALGSGRTTPGQMGMVEPPLSQMGVVLATTILVIGGGQTTPKGHGGGSATPKTGLGGGQPSPCGPKGWLSHPLNFLFFILYIYIYSSHVSLDMTLETGVAQVRQHM